MGIEDPFIGSGWSFPPRFNKAVASVDMSSGIQDIEESLEIIFTTILGERIMRPDFGCSLKEQVFEVMNTSRISWLETLITNAIIYHEPRIDADQITVEPDQNNGLLQIGISYRVRGANSRFNFVYPYYLTER
ncbi:MAG: GPW/gp25 family protein [Xanthomonadales bacterium]|nr:GPW/gp25 family protein [Xanthomonadales bacterium]